MPDACEALFFTTAAHWHSESGFDDFFVNGSYVKNSWGLIYPMDVYVTHSLSCTCEVIMERLSSDGRVMHLG